MGATRLISIVLVVAAMWLASPSPALGQKPAADDSKARAQVHYQAGLQAYNVGDFDSAIAEWKEGYRLLAMPDFLFNIAQAYRAKRDAENALFFYNAFLRERPDAPNLDEVVGLRDEMARLLAEQRKQVPPDQPDEGDPEPRGAAEPAEGPALSGEQAPADVGGRGRSLRVTGLVLGGAGAAVLATGVVFSLAASGAASDLEAAARSGDPWTPALEDKERTGKRNETLGVALLAGGGAALVGGAVTYALGWRKGRRPVSIAIVPRAGDGFMAWAEF